MAAAAPRILGGYAVRTARLFAASRPLASVARAHMQSDASGPSCARPLSGFASQNMSASLQLHRFQQSTNRRHMALTPEDVEHRMRGVNDLFVEARELIADALDSQGTKYFEEDLDVSEPL